MEPYLSARAAAEYVGYAPTDKGRRAFYAFVRRHQVAKKWRGRRLVFQRADLERALAVCSAAAPQTQMDAMGDLARRMARGEARPRLYGATVRSQT